MEVLLITGCSVSLLIFLFLGWLLRNRKQKRRFNSSLVIAECFQPQVVCKSVPCQHPYYRVISEYSGQKSQNCDLPDIKEESDNESSKKISDTEWYRKLSLSSIPRKTGHEIHNARRSSISDVDGTPVRVANVKPPVLV